MKLVADVFFIILLFFLFSYSHTILASDRVKEFLKIKLGRLFLLYRIFYNLLALLSIFLILKFAPKPDIIIYDLNPPFDIIIFILQLFSLGGILWAGKYMNIKEFLGTNQLINFFKERKQENDISAKLIISGPHKFSRHPIYFFSILFLGLRPQMNLFYFISFICFVIYFYIGSIYEEKKLLRQYGKEYQDYIDNVPRIFPSIKKLHITKNFNQV